jgi:outer membrane protein OmpA-like peptidoglycan-associated protein
MKYTRLLFVFSILLLGATTLFATEPASPSVAMPDTVMFGPEQVAFNEALVPVPFDYNDHIINTPNEESALEHDANWLKAHPDVRFYISGYSDWRGGVLYNMTLTQKRAEAVKNGLVRLGVAPERILISAGWGKLYPTCAEQDEACWAQNRRVRLVYVPSWFGAGTKTSSGM